MEDKFCDKTNPLHESENDRDNDDMGPADSVSLVAASSTSVTSSVARGGWAMAPPIGLKSIQNSTFLVLLRPIFAPKMKTALPPKDLLLFGPEKWSFFFWSSPKVGQEKAVNFGEHLFFFFLEIT